MRYNLIMPKKVLLALLIFIAIVGGAFYITRMKLGATTVANELVLTEQQETKLYQDTDGDNLKDWEEQLWGTNLNEADSDADGTSDYEEIRQGRDPLAKNTSKDPAKPSDLMASSTVASKVNKTLESDLSETAKFSRELFAKYASAFRDESSKTPNGATAIVTEQLDIENYNKLLEEKVANSTGDDSIIYAETDFKTTTDNEKNLHQYGNELATIISGAQKKYPEQETQLFDGLAAGLEVELEDFDKAAKRYATIKEGMLTMTVPKGILPLHTRVVNLSGVFESAVPYMKYAVTDPIKSMSWISLYPNTLQFLVKSLSEMSAHFRKNGIVFKKSEPGYVFTGGI